MTKWWEYLKSPATLISLGVFLFGLGITYATINHRLNELEDFKESVNVVEIQKTLAEIKTDLSWIKANLHNN